MKNFIFKFIQNQFKLFSKKEKIIFLLFSLLGLILHLVSSIRGRGYLHPDEYFQIIEFASYKLGITPPSFLAWEFNANVRPTIQPWIFYIIASLFGASNPWRCILVSKIFSGLFSWLVLTILAIKIKPKFNHKISYWILIPVLFLSGILTYVNSMFTSENFSGLFFCLGLIFFLKYESSNNSKAAQESKSAIFWMGISFGLSTALRLQSILFLFGFFILLLISKFKFKNFVQLGIAFLIPIIFLTLLDSLFYKELVFTPYQYYYQNIVKGVANTFGVSPWHWYYDEFFNSFNNRIYLFLFFLFFSIFNKKSYLFLFPFISFISIHSLIDHKEFRFLFPALYLYPFILAFGIEAFLDFYKIIFSRILFAFLTILGFIVYFNLINYEHNILRPRISEFVYQEFFYYHKFQMKCKRVLTTSWSNYPKKVLVKDLAFLHFDLPSKFVQQFPQDYNAYIYSTWEDAKSILDSIKEPCYMALTNKVNNIPEIEKKLGRKVQLEYSYNNDIPSLFKIGGWQNRTQDNLILYIEK